jgi:hypothetical protein
MKNTEIVVNIRFRLSFWDAIKLRVAGQAAQKFINTLTADIKENNTGHCTRSV